MTITLRLDILIEDKETDGVLYRKAVSFDLPEYIESRKKFIRVAVTPQEIK